MRDTEWSLMLFTLLTQLAVGMFVVIGTMNTLYISKSNNLAAKEIVIKILISVVVVLILAILASFLHIGKPRSAVYAINHFSHSWLSREIAFLLLFTLLAGISVVLQHFSIGSNLIRDRLALITGIISIITLIAMSKIYMLETVPAWNTFSTPIQFLTTSLSLGGLAALLFFTLFCKGFDSGELLNEITKLLLPVLLFLLSINLIAFLIHLYMLPGMGIAGLGSYKILTETHIVFLILRLCLMLISIILVCILLFTDTNAFTISLLFILCAVVLLSEIIGRYLFYASYSRVGM